MFTTGSGSVGTTTTGADISTIIPSTDYANILSDNLGIALTTVTDETLPLFLIDSEGMGVRGDAFDFITTSPPAVIAKVTETQIVTFFKIILSLPGCHLDRCRESTDGGNPLQNQ